MLDDEQTCPDCGVEMAYDFEEDWDDWRRWWVCPKCGVCWSEDELRDYGKEV